MLKELLLVFREIGLVLEGAQLDGQEVHVQLGDAVPGAEGGEEADLREPPAAAVQGLADVFAFGCLFRAVPCQDSLSFVLRYSVVCLGAADAYEVLCYTVGSIRCGCFGGGLREGLGYSCCEILRRRTFFKVLSKGTLHFSGGSAVLVGSIRAQRV